MFEPLMHIPGEFWVVLAQMAPYLLFGFLVAGILSVIVSPETVEKHLGGKGILSVLKAAAFGVKSSLRTKAQLSVAPWMRSMRPGKAGRRSSRFRGRVAFSIRIRALFLLSLLFCRNPCHNCTTS